MPVRLGYAAVVAFSLQSEIMIGLLLRDSGMMQFLQIASNDGDYAVC